MISLVVCVCVSLPLGASGNRCDQARFAKTARAHIHERRHCKAVRRGCCNAVRLYRRPGQNLVYGTPHHRRCRSADATACWGSAEQHRLCTVCAKQHPPQNHVAHVTPGVAKPALAQELRAIDSMSKQDMQDRGWMGEAHVEEYNMPQHNDDCHYV